MNSGKNMCFALDKATVVATSLLALLLVVMSGAAHAQDSIDLASNDKNTHECLIEPMRVLKLGAESQGLIESLEVDRGSQVVAGDVVAKLVSRVERSRVEQAEQRAGMMGEIEARKADLELARIVLLRSERLHKQSLISMQEIDEARAQQKVSQAALQQAKDNVEQLKLEFLRVKALLSQRVIRSPIDGVVVELHTFAGEYVQDNPIMTIAQLDPLRVEVVLPLSEFGKYNEGDRALVQPELGGPKVEAVVGVVDSLLDASSGTFGIRLLLDNPNRNLVAGQKCSVRIVSDAAVVTSELTEEK